MPKAQYDGTEKNANGETKKLTAFFFPNYGTIEAEDMEAAQKELARRQGIENATK